MTLFTLHFVEKGLRTTPEPVKGVAALAPRVNAAEGVLPAFLRVGEFKHGARSIEALLDMSRLEDFGIFVKASLPIRDQLELNVNAREFEDLLSANE